MAEVAHHEPVDAIRDPDLRGARRLAELPFGPRRIVAMVEVLLRLEVVFGLRDVGDLAADARETEDAHGIALVRVAVEVELPAAEEQVVRVDLARRLLVA